MAENESVFNTLSVIDVGDKIEKKMNHSYLSWSYAWGELLKVYPDATYTVYENQQGWNYHTDGKTCWVKCGVTVKGIEHVEMLPVMDSINKSILASNVTSCDVNKSIQRCVTKAIARHGLGLYIYAGEDLPESDESLSEIKNESKPVQKAKTQLPKEESWNYLLGLLLNTYGSMLNETGVNMVKDTLKNGGEKECKEMYDRSVAYLSKMGIKVA